MNICLFETNVGKLKNLFVKIVLNYGQFLTVFYVKIKCLKGTIPPIVTCKINNYVNIFHY